MSSFFPDRLQTGLTAAEYVSRWREKLGSELKGLDKEARKRLYYVRYNFERFERVAAQYEISEALKQASRGISEPQMWMLLTEDWCGDSAYALPVVNAAVHHSDHVELRLLNRDENLDIMDDYLTNGGRSIPKLVAFDMSGQEIFRWGPRPQVLAELRQQWQQDGADPRT
ncbi:MAG: thioredoxin family protein, partial [Rhodothermales bacterium]